MTYARDFILTLTVLSLIYIADNWPRPVKDNQVPYCVIQFKAAGKDAFGNPITGWATGYGPCSLQDIYREI